MIVLSRAPRPAPAPIDLGRGVILHLARPLDSVALSRAAYEAEQEVALLCAGSPTVRAWPLRDDEVADLAAGREDPGAAALADSVGRWMRAVLQALAAAEAVEGVTIEGGAADTFETLALLFRDPFFEALWSRKTAEVAEYWAAEKNVSAAGPNGAGPAALTSAPDVETPAAPAPAGSLSMTAPETPSAAPIALTTPELSPVESPGASALHPAPGDVTNGAAA